MIIDAVIPWVDGNDKVLAAKRAHFSGEKIVRMDDIAGQTRYANEGEIYWCVASINRFAPFIHKIYIVTDGQDPHMEEFLERNFPDGHIPVQIVDHREIFKGYEEYLPVFNSLSIETMQWRIPGLSEHALMFNDDFLFTSPVSESDFFSEDGSVLCVGKTFSLPFAKVLRHFKNKKYHRKVVTLKNTYIEACDLIGEKKSFIYMRHTPVPQLVSCYRDYYEKHPDHLIHNLKYRFRDAGQYNPQEVMILLMRREKKLKVIPGKKYDFFLQPKRSEEYFDKKMEKLRNGSFKFCCFNSLDQASERNKEQVRQWIREILQIK